MKNFYLDESGNTGDVTLAASDYSFADQPYFILSCFGMDDEHKLAVEIARLKRAHKIQSPELKFKNIRSKPKFMLELLDFLNSEACPIFIEATDKRFTLIIHMIECLIIPPISSNDFGPEASFIKNIMADWMFENVGDCILDAFCSACIERSPQSIVAAFDALERLVETKSSDEVAAGIIRFLQDTKADFLAAQKPENNEIMKYLPVPDTTRTGKYANILPHVPSLLHIYGRLNRYLDGQLAGVILHHDEQVQFDQALQDGMKLAESDVGDNLPRQPLANFKFDQTACLKFCISDKSTGVQVADLLAGMIGFGLKEVGKSPISCVPIEWKEAFDYLFRKIASNNGAGVNVVSASDVAKRLLKC